MKTDNELIAEFMGEVICAATSDVPPFTSSAREFKTFSECQEFCDKWRGEGYKPFLKRGPMEYGTSWDWLMPVVEKIEGVKLTDDGLRVFSTGANVTIFYKACQIEYEPDDESGDDHDEWDTQTQGETKHEAVYKAVVEFIKWYNENSKP